MAISVSDMIREDTEPVWQLLASSGPSDGKPSHVRGLLRPYLGRILDQKKQELLVAHAKKKKKRKK